MPEISTKPYLLRAIYEWCTDNGYTPYVAALVDANTRVPREFVKNGEIVLNISFAATSALKLDNEFISFSARFGGIARDICVPVENVVAIYARENGQGMAFEVTGVPASNDKQSPDATTGNAGVKPADGGPNLTAVPSTPEEKNDGEPDTATQPDDQPDPPKKGGRPTLTRIK